MAEIDRINELFQRAYGGSSWHGPSVRDLLSDLTAEEASAQLIPGEHNIWQLVRHIMFWQDFATRMLKGEQVNDPSDVENWPELNDVSTTAWQKTLDELRNSQREFREALEGWDEAKLQEVVPDRSYRYYQLLYGVIHHNLYHAGQIALLKKIWSRAQP